MPYFYPFGYEIDLSKIPLLELDQTSGEQPEGRMLPAAFSARITNES